MTQYSLSCKKGLIVLFLGFFLSACGGGGGGSSSDTPKDTNTAPIANAGSDRTATVGSGISITGSGSDADGDTLSYSWTLTSQPNGSSVSLLGASNASARFTPDAVGDYTLRLVVNDGTVDSTPDSVIVTAQDNVVPGPGGGVLPIANYAPLVAHFNDSFNNGLVAKSDLNSGFWKQYSTSNVSLQEGGNLLTISSTGTWFDSGSITSPMDQRFNFFVQPLRFSLKGLTFNGDAANAEKQIKLSLTSTSESSWSSPDALVLKISGNGRLILAWKNDLPDADAETINLLLDQNVSQTPTEAHLSLDQTSYLLSVNWAGGSQSFSGAHNIPVAQWGARGDAALSLEGRRNAATSNGTTATLELDSLSVDELKFLDVFSNDTVSDSGHRGTFWQNMGNSSTTAAESNGELVLNSTGSIGSPLTGVVSAVDKQFNFFAQKLLFTGKVYLDGNVSNNANNIARLALTSERASSRAAASAIALAIGADKRVRLGWKINNTGAIAEQTNVMVNQLVAQVPTSFALAMSKNNYTLTVFWNGGSQTFTGGHGMVWHNWNKNGHAALSLESQRNSSASNETATARWQQVAVLRDQEYWLAPTIFGPLGDSFELDNPRKDSTDTLAQWGMLDVTKPPFNADPTGQRDSTKGLQHAISFAREHFMVAFFPAGTYKVSDTLTCTQPLTMLTTETILDSRESPCAIMGSRAGANRPKIYLAPNAPGFNDPGNRKHVVNIWARSYLPNETPEDEFTNVSYNQMFVNIDIEIGSGNAGAVGIRLYAAQGSSVQETTIDATNGFAGLEGIAGSGGSHAGVTVIGGQYGLYLKGHDPAATITGMTLIGQTKSAIYYNGHQTLSIVGAKISVPANANGKAAIEVQGRMAQLGQISMVDSQIQFESPNSNNTAIWTDSSIYLNNVYVQNAGMIVQTIENNVLAGNATGWRLVKEYADGIQPPPYSVSGYVYQYQAPVYQNGIRSTTDLEILGSDGVQPPANLQSLHLWGTNFPSFESAGAVNVKQAPYNAKGDGVADDTAAIQQAINDSDIVFLPKGHYRISSTLLLRPNTKIVGVSRTLSNLVPIAGGAFTNASNPQPLVRTANDANAQTFLAFMQLQSPMDIAGAYALHWRAGRNSVFRAVNLSRTSDYGFEWRPGKPTNPPNNIHPLVYISHNGGGNWYNFYQESPFLTNAPSYRHMLIEGTTEPLRFYQFNPEHAKSEANSEIRNARNVAIYGMKSESNYVALWIRDSDYINLFGYGGNGAAFESTYTYPAGFEQFTPSLFRVERTPNYRLVQLVDEPRVTGDHYVFGRGILADLWHMTLEVDPTNNTILSNVLDRPVLYKRGNP